MDSRGRFSNQQKDPFAGSVLFGSGNSPQPTQAVSPVMHQASSFGLMSPMQTMDGFSTVRSPHQGRRFGTHDSAQKSTRGLKSESKRPPLGSILDDKMSVLSSHADTAEDYYPNQTPGSITLEEERGLFSGDRDQSFHRSARKFPLFPSSSLRNELSGREGLSSNPFASPVATRPPLRSTLDVFSGGRGLAERLDQQYSAQQDTGTASATSEQTARSPVLTLGPYVPSMDRMDAAWNCWVVVSGFYPSAAGRDAVLQLFTQFGDIEDHVLTSGNYLYIKYSSPVHAERAASQHGSFLNSDTLLSVLVLNPRLAQHMGLQFSRDGALQVSNALVPGTDSTDPRRTLGLTGELSSASLGNHTDGVLGGGLRQRQSFVPGQGIVRGEEEKSLLGMAADRDAAARRARHDTPELYLQPSRRKSICERVVEYFFAY